MQETIKSNLSDLIVYGTKAYEHCELFTKLCDDYSNKPYILREFDNKDFDRSLNRCLLDSTFFSGKVQAWYGNTRYGKRLHRSQFSFRTTYTAVD